MDLKQRIIDFIAEHFDIDAEDISSDMSLREDLNVPEVEITDLFPKLGEEFGVEIDLQDQENLQTIEDIIMFISDQYEEDI